MKNLSRTLSLTLTLALGLSACAPGLGPSELGTTAQALTVVSGRVDSARLAEAVEYEYLLALRGEGTLLNRFITRAVNELPGAVVESQTDDDNAFRRAIAEGLVARSPITGEHYYDADGVAQGERTLRDLADPTGGLITVTFEATADGERVSITCLDGQRWTRVFSPAELRDVEACVGALLDEVQRQVDVYRGTAR